MKKTYKHYKAVYYTGSTWGLYGEKVHDRECDHAHRSKEAAYKCLQKDTLGRYNGVKEF